MPVLVTTNVYGIVEPAVMPVAVPAVLTRLRLCAAGIGVVTASDAVTFGPDGGFADTVAAFVRCPASTSGWVSMYVAVHVVLTPGANVVTGQSTLPTVGSSTTMLVSVTLPVFFTMNVYGIVEFAVLPVGVPACLSSVTVVVATIGVSIAPVAVTEPPTGGVAVAVAEFSTWPASASAWVIVYVPVHVVCAPGASGVAAQVTGVILGSVTPTACTVTLPVFVTTKLYGIVEPAVFPVAEPAVLTTVMLGVEATGVVMLSPSVTAAPFGGFADAVAELSTCPRSTSACVSGYIAVHVTEAPGATSSAGHATVPTLASLTLTACSVTLPVLVTRNVYGIVEVAVLPLAEPADFTSVRLGDAVIVESAVSVALTAAPSGGVPDAVAVLVTCPASTSACVAVYVAVQVVRSPGASCETGQVTEVTWGSLTLTAWSVTLPVFVTRNV